MTEQDLIKKLQTLKDIKPNKDWAIFAKSQILKEESKRNVFVPVLNTWQVLKMVFVNQYAFAGAIVLFVVMGTFGFSLKSNPTEMLSSVKKAVEDSQMVFMSGEEKVKFNLDKASQQMDDLTKAAQDKDESKQFGGNTEDRINHYCPLGTAVVHLFEQGESLRKQKYPDEHSTKKYKSVYLAHGSSANACSRAKATHGKAYSHDDPANDG